MHHFSAVARYHAVAASVELFVITMTKEEFLKRLDQIRVWKHSGRRAPHKPLLLLLALGRVLAGRERLALYGGEIDGPLTDLLKHFGPPRQPHHPEAPFSHLYNDGLWDIPGHSQLPATRSGTLLVSGLIEQEAAGGFPPAVYELLRFDPHLVQKAAQVLLDSHFPPSLHDDIRRAVGISTEWMVQDSAAAERAGRPRRDPGFRPSVLRAYERCCAVCGFDVRIGDDLFGIDAAHIMWHTEGGPDEVQNGLALCNLHHKALDRGVLGLTREEGDEGEYTVVISSDMNSRSKPANWLLDYHGQPLRRPQSSNSRPNRKFVEWHNQEVFCGPARDLPT